MSSMLELTENAIRKVIELEKEQKDAAMHLRIFVTEGGCSGMEYGMKFDYPAETDHRIGDGRFVIIVDPESMKQIMGSVVDFDDSLHGTGFSVRNPQANETCGCGKSFN